MERVNASARVGNFSTRKAIDDALERLNALYPDRRVTFHACPVGGSCDIVAEADVAGLYEESGETPDQYLMGDVVHRLTARLVLS